MRGKIVEVGTTSELVKAAIEEAMQEAAQPYGQHQTIQPVSWAKAVAGIDPPQLEPSEATQEMER